MPSLKVLITCWDICNLYAADNRALVFSLRISKCFPFLDVSSVILVFWKFQQDFFFSEIVWDFMVTSEMNFRSSWYIFTTEQIMSHYRTLNILQLVTVTCAMPVTWHVKLLDKMLGTSGESWERRRSRIFPCFHSDSTAEAHGES